jgi:transposase
MYGRERRVLLRHYLEQGLSKTEVARSLGVSRRTLYHWIHGGQLDRDLDNAPVRYRPRPPVARKIDPYREMIQARLAEYPKLSATRLFEEVRAAGYAGGYSQVKEYVR